MKYIKHDDQLRKRVRLAKAINYPQFSYKEISEIIDVSPNAFYNWLNRYYELSSSKYSELDSLINDLLE